MRLIKDPNYKFAKIFLFSLLVVLALGSVFIYIIYDIKNSVKSPLFDGIIDKDFSFIHRIDKIHNGFILSGEDKVGAPILFKAIDNEKNEIWSKRISKKYLGDGYSFATEIKSYYILSSKDETLFIDKKTHEISLRSKRKFNHIVPIDSKKSDEFFAAYGNNKVGKFNINKKIWGKGFSVGDVPKDYNIIYSRNIDNPQKIEQEITQVEPNLVVDIVKLNNGGVAVLASNGTIIEFDSFGKNFKVIQIPYYEDVVYYTNLIKIKDGYVTCRRGFNDISVVFMSENSSGDFEGTLRKFIKGQTAGMPVAIAKFGDGYILGINYENDAIVMFELDEDFYFIKRYKIEKLPKMSVLKGILSLDNGSVLLYGARVNYQTPTPKMDFEGKWEDTFAEDGYKIDGFVINLHSKQL